MEDFRAFTSKFSAKVNVLINEVGISLAFTPGVNHTTLPQIVQTKAIWDTGASMSVVTSKLAKQIGLVATGKTRVDGVNSSKVADTYFVNLYLPHGVTVAYLKVVEAENIAGDVDMLIGMDVIGIGDFSVYSENGNTVMSYRTPGLGGTDFVEEANKIRSQKQISDRLNQQRAARKSINLDKQRKKSKVERQNRKKGRHKK